MATGKEFRTKVPRCPSLAESARSTALLCFVVVVVVVVFHCSVPQLPGLSSLF